MSPSLINVSQSEHFQRRRTEQIRPNREDTQASGNNQHGKVKMDFNVEHNRVPVVRVKPNAIKCRWNVILAQCSTKRTPNIRSWHKTSVHA